MKKIKSYTLQKDRYGETDTSLKTTKDIPNTSKQIAAINHYSHIFLMDHVEYIKLMNWNWEERYFRSLAAKSELHAAKGKILPFLKKHY